MVSQTASGSGQQPSDQPKLERLSFRDPTRALWELRQELDFASRLEHSVSPDSTSQTARSGSAAAPLTAEQPVSTASPSVASPPSSAEYIVGNSPTRFDGVWRTNWAGESLLFTANPYTTNFAFQPDINTTILLVPNPLLE